MPACGFGEYQKVVTVLPGGLKGTCQSVYMAVSNGKIAVDTQEAANTARKRTLLHMGKAAGSLLSNPLVVQIKMSIMYLLLQRIE